MVAVQGSGDQICEVGAATGIEPYDHSQPVAHMISLSFSLQIKSALLSTAESKATWRQFPWYCGFAVAWQEGKLAPNMQL